MIWENGIETCIISNLQYILKIPIKNKFSSFGFLIFTDNYIQREIILTTKRVNKRTTQAVCRRKSILYIPTLIQGKWGGPFAKGSGPFFHLSQLAIIIGFLPYGSAGKESACNVGDLVSIPGLVRSPGEGKGYPLQYSGLENSMDCIVHGVAKSRTQLSDFHFHFPITMRVH